MKDCEYFPKVVRAEGPYLFLEDGTQLLDGVSSWWCVIHGYNHPALNEALRKQSENFSHVMLGGLTHGPAEQLADKLVELTPAGLDHVFFTDSGSVGMEVALKMAVQYWMQSGKPEKHRFLALKGAYHGDTTGVMAVSDPDEGMHHLFSGILAQNLFCPAPSHGFDPDLDQLAQDLSTLERLLSTHHHELAAFVVEPLLQGAGGFNMYSPAYLNQAKLLCERYDVLLIFDEVATGFGRTGRLFATDHTDIVPDIMVLSKALTAGYLGLAATLSTTAIYEAFYGPDASTALMHGPTFTGNALACSVALKSIELIEEEGVLARVEHLSRVFSQAVESADHPLIESARSLGACLALTLTDPSQFPAIQKRAIASGLWIRPFERYLYLMPPYCLSNDQAEEMVAKFFQSLG